MNSIAVKPDYIELITAGARTPAAAYVARLMNHPILLDAAQRGLPIFWWDPLAAISALQGVFDPIVSYVPLRTDVVLDGPQEGRTVVSQTGSPILVGMSADRQRFENTFLATLNGG